MTTDDANYFIFCVGDIKKRTVPFGKGSIFPNEVIDYCQSGCEHVDDEKKDKESFEEIAKRGKGKNEHVAEDAKELEDEVKQGTD